MHLLYARVFVTAFGALGASAFAVPAGDGLCSPDDALANLCFVSPGGFVVEAVTGPDGEFPVIDADGNSVFSYRITGPGASGGSCAMVWDISHASILLPAACPAGPFTILDAHPAAELQTGGQGEPSCDFGTGDLESDILKWDEEVECESSLLLTVVVEGIVPAVPTSFSLKAGQACSTDTILGPGCPDVSRFCPGAPNSTGQSVQIDFSGSLSIADNSFHLHASGLPPTQEGFFFFGAQGTDLPLGNGKLCIGGRIVRMDKSPFLPDGTTVLHLDFTVPPADVIAPGIPYYFQFFYLDLDAGGAGFNSSDALVVNFSP